MTTMLNVPQTVEGLLADLQRRGLTRAEAISTAQYLVDSVLGAEPPTVVIHLPAAWSAERRASVSSLLQRVVDTMDLPAPAPAPVADWEPMPLPFADKPDAVLATLPSGEPVRLHHSAETGEPSTVEVTVGGVTVGYCLDAEARGFRPVFADNARDELHVDEAEGLRDALAAALDTVVRLGREMDAAQQRQAA